MSGNRATGFLSALLLIATFSGASAANARAGHTTPLAPSEPAPRARFLSDLTIAQTSSTPFVFGSSNETYTLTVTNNGNTATTGTITIVDTLPAGVAYVSRGGNKWTVSYNAGTRVVTATNTTAANAGASAQDLVLTVSIAAAAVPSVTNRAYVSGGGETNTANNSSSHTTAVDAPDLTIAKTGPASFVQATNASYTLTVTNSGTVATAGTITLTDTLPAGMTYVSSTGAGWTVTPTGNVIVATSATALAAAATRPLTITVTPGSAAVPSVTNRAYVSGGGEAVTSNNSSSVTTSVTAVIDLEIAKAAGALSDYLPGTYTITVSNPGLVASSGTLTVKDTLPAGMTFSSASGSGWSVTNSGQVVTATYAGSLAPAASAPFTINVALGDAAASVTNVAYLSGGGDVTTANNTASVTTSVTQRPDLIVVDTVLTPFNFTVGTNGTYSLYLFNNGTSPTFGTVTLVDTLPVGITYVSNTGNNWTVNWNAGTRVLTATNSTPVPAGGISQGLALTVAVAASAYPSVNTRVWGTGGGDVKTDNGDASTIPVLAPDLAITKSAPSSFVQTINGTYSIDVTNVGNLTTTGTITVRDTLPAGMTYVSATGAGWTITGTNNVVVATRTIAIAPAGSASFTVTVTPGAAAVPSVTNKAVVTGGTQIIPSNDTSFVTTPVTVGVIDLALSKASPAFTQFTNSTYTLSIVNNGTIGSAGTITVLDTLPAGVTFSSAGGSGWTASANGQVVTATNSDSLAVGATTNLTLNVAVGAAAASITNRAYLTGGGDVTPANNSATKTTAVTQRPDLTVTTTSSTPFAYGSVNETYTLSVANGGGAASSGTITITDTLPAGVAYISRGGNNWTVAYNAGTRVVTATNASAVNAGGTAQNLVLTVSVAAAAYPSVTNTAWVSGGSDANTANNDGATTTAVTAADLTIAKSSPPSFAQGLTSTYTITVTNVGTAATTGTITVRDTLPTGMTYVSATGTNWTISGTNNVVIATRTVAIAAAGTATFTVDVTPQPAAVPSVTNKAVVSGGNQLIAANDTVYLTTPVTVGTVDLAITKTSPAFAQFSSNAYTVTVTNSGTITSSGTITVRDTLPAGITYASGSGTGWTFSNTGQVVLATYTGTLAAAASAPFTLNVTVGAAAASITNRAYLTGGGDATPANNTGTATTAVTLRPDLTLTKTSSSPFAYGSVTETYTLAVQNGGGVASSGTITVTDTLPAGVAYISRAGNNWTVSYNAGTRVVTATNTSAINAGAASQNLVLTVSVGAAAYPSSTNTAWVSGGNDALTTNNSATTTSAVQAPDVTLSKVAASAFSQGSNSTYTMTVTNVGNQPTAGTVTVTDSLPAGLTYVIAAGTNWTFNITGSVFVATNTTAIAANGTSVFTLTVKPQAAAVPLVTNTAIVSGGNQINLANDTSTVTTSVTGTSVVVDLTVGASAAGAFQQSFNSSYTVTVNNIGTATSGGTITVTDTLPSGIAYVSGSGSGWSVSAVGQVVTATSSTLIAPSSSSAVVITIVPSAGAIPSVVNRAWVAGGGDSNSGNNGSGNVTTTVTGIPAVTVLSSVSPSGTVPPGTVLTYNASFLNAGNSNAVSVVVTELLSASVSYQLNSVMSTLPSGVTANVQYYNGTTWAYTPVSGGCGAPAGYDSCVTKVQWLLQSPLAAGATGNVWVSARVK